MTRGDASRIVFFGTPDWAVPSLEALAASSVEVHAVVTNPDRPSGRGYELKASPIKRKALELDIPVLQPEKARDLDFADYLRKLAPDVAVVVAYGKILPGTLLSIPRMGFVNMHFSLLPAFRGAAPVQRAVMAGMEKSGASIMVLTEGMDEGPVLTEREEAIRPQETAGELGARLAELGAALLVEALPSYLAGELEPVPQDEAKATYAPKISSEEAQVDWRTEPKVIFDRVRGLNPVPGAWTTVRGQRLKIHAVSLTQENIPLTPGEVREGPRGPLVGTRGLPLLLEVVQLAGKKRTTGVELARGLRFVDGERLGEDVEP